MRLIVGLGNYPAKYHRTRHNFGFLAADFMAEKFHFTPFKFEKKYQAELSFGQIKGEKVILCKPHTLMNLSGQSVGPLMRFYKLKTRDLWVLSDDLDQDFGACRLREKGSDGGQKGLRHIAQVLSSKEFYRLKFGINNVFRKRYSTDEFVLGKFTAEEAEQIPTILAAGLKKLEQHW